MRHCTRAGKPDSAANGRQRRALEGVRVALEATRFNADRHQTAHGGDKPMLAQSSERCAAMDALDSVVAAHKGTQALQEQGAQQRQQDKHH